MFKVDLSREFDWGFVFLAGAAVVGEESERMEGLGGTLCFGAVGGGTGCLLFGCGRIDH
jgi:hypothetical protein